MPYITGFSIGFLFFFHRLAQGRPVNINKNPRFYFVNFSNKSLKMASRFSEVAMRIKWRE